MSKGNKNNTNNNQANNKHQRHHQQQHFHNHQAQKQFYQQTNNNSSNNTTNTRNNYNNNPESNNFPDSMSHSYVTNSGNPGQNGQMQRQQFTPRGQAPMAGNNHGAGHPPQPQPQMNAGPRIPVQRQFFVQPQISFYHQYPPMNAGNPGPMRPFIQQNIYPQQVPYGQGYNHQNHQLFIAAPMQYATVQQAQGQPQIPQSQPQMGHPPQAMSQQPRPPASQTPPQVNTQAPNMQGMNVTMQPVAHPHFQMPHQYIDQSQGQNINPGAVPVSQATAQSIPPAVNQAINPTQVAAQAPSAYRKDKGRRSGAIPIVDPKTGKDIMDNLFSDQQQSAEADDDKSAKADTKPEKDKRIVEEFASKVSQVASGISSQEIHTDVENAKEVKPLPVEDKNVVQDITTKDTGKPAEITDNSETKFESQSEEKPSSTEEESNNLEEKSKNRKKSSANKLDVSPQDAEKTVVDTQDKPETKPDSMEESNKQTDEEAIKSDEESKEKSEETSTDSAESKKPKLKYVYKEDQWSPINPNGKKKYDREFLIQLQKDPLSNVKPENLPSMEIVKDKANDRSNRNYTNKDFTPSFYVKNSTSLSKYPSKRGSQNGKGREPKKIISGLSIQEKVELNTAENAWKPKQVAKKSTDQPTTDENPMEELARQTRSILNKLTPQKFDTLVGKFNELIIDTEDKLRMCIELVFEKAVDEPGFSIAYARFCEVLKWKSTINQNEAPATKNSSSKGGVNFRKLLIGKCQVEFEKDYMSPQDVESYKNELENAPEDKKKEIQLAYEEKERKARRRSLGNIRFIGELYKLHMLTCNIMHECIRKLLRSSTDEEALECLCRLVTTVGKDLEAETKNMLAEKKQLVPLDEYFRMMQAIVDGKKTSSRVRFMLQDLIELRQDNWKPRRDVSGPKTIDQIHKEAEKEKSEQELANFLNKNSSYKGGDRKRSSRGPQHNEEPGWSTVNNNKSSGRGERIEGNKLNSNINNLLKNQSMKVDSMQFGPGSKSFNWAKGAANSSQTKEDQPPKSTNRFEAFRNATESNENNDSFRQPRGSRSMGGGPPSRNSRGHSNQDNRKHNQGGISSMRSNGPRQMYQQHTSGLPPQPTSYNQKSAEPVNRQDKMKGAENLDNDKVKELATPLLGEFYDNKDQKEAINCVYEKFHSSTISLFVEETINHVLDEKDPKRKTMVGDLFVALVKEGLLTQKQFIEGSSKILEFAEDIVMDVPQFWDFFGAILAPIFGSDTFSLSILPQIYNISNNKDLSGKFLAKVLKQLSTSFGNVKTNDLWKQSKLSWNQFVDADKVNDFIKQYELEFISSQDSAPRANKVSYTIEQISSQLRNMFSKKDFDNKTVFEWIDANIENVHDFSFIRALTDTLTESAIEGHEPNCSLNEKRFTDRSSILKRYIDPPNVNREKQALYSLQNLMCRLQHPNKLLVEIFQNLCDEDIVTDDGFYAWRDCNDPSEQDGKGVAVNSTTHFFTWLSEPDKEENDASDD